MKIKNSSFKIFFAKFPKLFFSSFIFSAFLTLCLSASVVLGYFSGFNNILIWGLGLIPSTLFLPGLVTVTRKYIVEKNAAPILESFFAAVKENLKAFLLHGIVIYLICSCSFFAVLYYLTLTKINSFFGYIFTLYLFLIIALLIMMFYVPLITVTYNMRYRDIYKQSVKMIFGNFGANLLTLLSVAAVCGGFACAVTFTDGALKIAAIIFTLLFCPLTVCCIVTAGISKGIIDNLGEFTETNSLKNTADTEDADFSTCNTEDDFIFINGRMIRNPNKHKHDLY